MSITSILVNMQLGHENTALLDAAAEISSRFNAHVRGVAIAESFPLVVGAVAAYVISDMDAQNQAYRMEQMRAAEARFRSAIGTKARSLDWYAGVVSEDLTRTIATLARSHDLIVTMSDFRQPSSNVSNPSRVGDLVIQAGRPVFVVPPNGPSTHFAHGLIAWKDGPPARRAIFDSIPLLQKCSKVSIVEIAEKTKLPEAHNRLQELAEWLRRHAISAETYSRSYDVSHGAALAQIAKEMEVDLLVAGTYARSRYVERLFGGVTWDLILNGEYCVLTSH